jgi:hypothetical protein
MSSPDPCWVSPDLGRLLALRRVLRGGVIRFGRDEFASRGCRVPGYIGYYLVVLLTDGHARFDRPRKAAATCPCWPPAKVRSSTMTLSTRIDDGCAPDSGQRGEVPGEGPCRTVARRPR